MALAVVACLATACVTTNPVSRAPTPQAVTLDGVPVGSFGLERCGAGSLSAVLASYGLEVSVDELDAILPRATNGGVLTLDLLLEARARGFEARLVEGSVEAVARTIEEGLPPILVLQVLEMPGRQKDFYHYVIADGWDPGRSLVRLHFGDGRTRWVKTGWLEGPWTGTGHAMILIRPRSAEPPPDGQLSYAVALEQAGEIEHAIALYRRLLDGEPSPLLWTNLGNAEASRGSSEEAERAYREALALDPDHPEALNNLAWLLLQTGSDQSEVVSLARHAVAVDGPDPHLALDTLALALLDADECSEAREAVDRAVELAPPDGEGYREILEHRRRIEEACPPRAPGSVRE